LEKQRHLDANFTEFLEAIVRVIDKASPMPGSGENQSLMSLVNRRKQPLHVKIENAKHNLLSLCTPQYIEK